MHIFEGGETPFILACLFGRSKIVEIMIQNSVDFNIDLNYKCNRSTRMTGTYRDIDTLKNWKKVEYYKTDTTQWLE